MSCRSNGQCCPQLQCIPRENQAENDGSNYTDWVRNLRIILIAAKKAYVLDAPLGEAPVFPATQDIMNAW